MKFEVRFTGRAKGAIGIFHTCTAVVAGANEEEARVALYDTHEHIQFPKFRVVPDNTPTTAEEQQKNP